MIAECMLAQDIETLRPFRHSGLNVLNDGDMGACIFLIRR